jgi:hypothetical protein
MSRQPPPAYVNAGGCLIAPGHMTEAATAAFEPFESGYEQGQPVDGSITATRNKVFPVHGLMPL